MEDHSVDEGGPDGGPVGGPDGGPRSRRKDHLEDLMEVQTVTVEGLILFERLVLLEGAGCSTGGEGGGDVTRLRLYRSQARLLELVSRNRQQS